LKGTIVDIGLSNIKGISIYRTANKSKIFERVGESN